ncbi:hypothetical protein COL154_012982 [Colletotrichum chrysophilum]|nr:hypothetical protein KNSL1_012700 [Colletotrichum chrysophilum]KAJ0351335.1 hypothetical protein COL154_012982 [Colletotrichum chrysophilum]
MSSEQSIPSPATSDCGGAIAQAESPDDLASIYSNIPHVKIEPLKLSDDDLNTRRMNDLMAVGEGSSKPLYMQVVNRI